MTLAAHRKKSKKTEYPQSAVKEHLMKVLQRFRDLR